MLGRAVGIIQKFIPTLGSQYEFEDLVQESWLVFEKCRIAYVEKGNEKWGKVSNGKWFGRLFETALQRKFLTLCRKSKNRAYNLADTEAMLSGNVGVESLFEIMEALSPEARGILVDLVESPKSLETLSPAKKKLLMSQLTSNSMEINMATKATTSKKSATTVKKAATKAPASNKKASGASKTPVKEVAKKSLETELLEATAEDPRQEGEELQEYVDRVAEKVSEMDDDVFSKLSASARKWYESAQEASEKGTPIPSFLTKGKKVAATEKEPKARKGRELDPNSTSHKIREFILDNRNCTLKDLSEKFPKASKNTLLTMVSTARPFLRMLEERGVSF